jgi:SAM-dependent methyltransferase
MKEDEIRPQDIFDEYLKLCKEDIEYYFKSKKEETFIEVNCPGCGEDKIKEDFVKDDFRYNWCANCKTLYVSPLPPEDIFREYYTDGKSVKYWASHFYKQTEDARKENIFKPRVELIRDIFTKEIEENIDVLVDIGAGYGTFCELASESNYFKKVLAIEPSPPLIESLKKKNITVIEKFMEQVKPEDFQDYQYGKKLFCTFELWEHLYKPAEFLKSIKNVMTKGDYLLITTLNVLGFDLLMLWEKSKSISPPHHINLFNLDSLKLILNNNGFTIKKAFTPGKLDVDIIKNMNIIFEDRLFNYMINESDDKFRANLQEFISSNRLSSHMMVIAQL